jgi:hypothetical protein
MCSDGLEVRLARLEERLDAARVALDEAAAAVEAQREALGLRRSRHILPGVSRCPRCGPTEDNSPSRSAACKRGLDGVTDQPDLWLQLRRPW